MATKYNTTTSRKKNVQTVYEQPKHTTGLNLKGGKYYYIMFYHNVAGWKVNLLHYANYK